MAAQELAQQAKTPPERTSLGDLLDGELVTLYVGPEKHPFRVHKDVLCNKIPYFDKMFNGGFQEGTENSASLPEDNADAFDQLQQWVYTGNLRPFQWIEDSQGDFTTSNYPIVDVYLLTDKLCLFNLRDQVVTDFVSAGRQQEVFPNLTTVEDIYTRTPNGSTLRKYAAHCVQFVMSGMKSNFVYDAWGVLHIQKALKANDELLLDFLALVRENAGGNKPFQDPNEMSPCTFHHHREDEPCLINNGPLSG